MKIYTKTGDKGQTSLFGGKRVQKYSLRVDAYGSVDELNSLIGVVIAQNKKAPIQRVLRAIQNDLLTIGSALATPKEAKVVDLEARVKTFENEIDQMTKQLPVLANFILPGGGISGSHLHLARSVARRVERRIVQLSQEETIDKQILAYFNRLSDLLFTMARFVNYKEKEKETIWKKS